MLFCLHDPVAAVTPTGLCQSLHAIIYHLTCRPLFFIYYEDFVQSVPSPATSDIPRLAAIASPWWGLADRSVTADPCLAAFCWDRSCSCHSCAPSFVPQVGTCCFTEHIKGIINISGCCFTFSGAFSCDSAVQAWFGFSLWALEWVPPWEAEVCVCALLRQAIHCCRW